MSKKSNEKIKRRNEVIGMNERHPDASEGGKTRQYLLTALVRLKELEKTIMVKRASTRQKAAENTVSMFRARAQSLIQFLACGGQTSCASIQEAIFEPVIEYWTQAYMAKDESEFDPLDQTDYDAGDPLA